jgi:hypothetical protein
MFNNISTDVITYLKYQKEFLFLCTSNKSLAYITF